MNHMHPSRRHRGCGVCTPHKWRGLGRRDRDTPAVQRRLGLRRRYSRRDLGRLNAAAAQLGFAAVAARTALAVACPGAVQPLMTRMGELRDVATLSPDPITDAELAEMRSITEDLRSRAAAAVAGTAP